MKIDKFTNWVLIFPVLVSLFLVPFAHSKSTESDSLKKSPIFLYSDDYNGEYITYLLYKNHENFFLLSAFYLGDKIKKAVLYDIENRKVVEEETYTGQLDSATRVFKKIKTLELKDVSSLITSYGENYSRFYRIGQNKLYKGIGGRCSSPFDGYVRFDRQGKALSIKKSILLNRNTAHISDSDCNRMNGLSKTSIPATSLGIESVYQLSDDLYLISFSEYPLLTFMNGNLDLYTNEYLKVVDFDKVKGMEASKKLIDNWLKQPENKRESLFPIIASEVQKSFFN
ncbi:hypothetical protein L2734_09555 [Parashewanella spongiae]|nr:hypothetical protein [Parashewanella spongiae]MCL1078409.1 hypothetical protein [Parashewanella spongiae]